MENVSGSLNVLNLKWMRQVLLGLRCAYSSAFLDGQP